MKLKKKGEIFFVKETPDDYKFDHYKAHFLTKKEITELLKPFGKITKAKKAKKAS